MNHQETLAPVIQAGGHQETSTRWLLALIFLLWFQLFWALVPTWRFGEYYAFGWFVPFLALGLALRRWQVLLHQEPLVLANRGASVSSWLAVAAILSILVLAPLRLVTVADPTWRPPLLLHVGIVVGVTHILLGSLLGRRVTIGMMPVTVFALSAVPYPWQFEQALIGKLSAIVLHFTHEVFLLAGKPVELSGGRLAMGADVVEVTEGCSGIRSLQSLVMVSLFFGELLYLPTLRRLVLILAAGACAIGINTLRAVWLAEIHFNRGREAAADAHDRIGHTAFIASAAILYLSALLMLRNKPPGKLVITRTQAIPGA